MQDFGIIITCSKHDFLFAKGCLMSVKYFMPDTPVCLLVDGDFDLQQMPDISEVIVLDKSTIKSQFLKENSFGYGITKMIAFWESPFSRFMLIDSDTCVWGDMKEYADFDNFDMIVDKRNFHHTKNNIDVGFFETGEFERYFQDFDYMAYSDKYFVTGIIFGTKGLFPIEEYADILAFHRDHPHIFKLGEMGFLNFMALRADEQKRIRLGYDSFQMIMYEYPTNQLKDYAQVRQLPSVKGKPQLLHYCGVAKATVGNVDYHVEPMTFFRTRYINDISNIRDTVSVMKILLHEDVEFKISEAMKRNKTYLNYWKQRLKYKNPVLFFRLKSMKTWFSSI